MNLNNPSLPLRHEATDEVAIEIPSQNENPQIQIQQARMVQVTIGRPAMPSQTGNQQIASGQKILKKARPKKLEIIFKDYFQKFSIRFLAYRKQ